MRPRVAAIGTIVTEQMSEGRREKMVFSYFHTVSRCIKHSYGTHL